MFPYSAVISPNGCPFQQMHPKCDKAKVIAKVDNAGVHVSYAFPPEDIALKLQSFSHTEYDKPEFTQVGEIKRRIRAHLAPFNDAKLGASDPAIDPNLLSFSPEVRRLLMEHSLALKTVQEED